MGAARAGLKTGIYVNVIARRVEHWSYGQMCDFLCFDVVPNPIPMAFVNELAKRCGDHVAVGLCSAVANERGLPPGTPPWKP